VRPVRSDVFAVLSQGHLVGGGFLDLDNFPLTSGRDKTWFGAPAMRLSVRQCLKSVGVRRSGVGMQRPAVTSIWSNTGVSGLTNGVGYSAFVLSPVLAGWVAEQTSIPWRVGLAALTMVGVSLAALALPARSGPEMRGEARAREH